MLNSETLSLLRGSKNLLAFSAGVDSTALFFILQDFNIEFDIAIVDYGVREEALAEVAYAIELAKRYNKRIFIKRAPKFESNFESQARDFRYNFFSGLIKKYNYKNLLTAHQLNDKIEWFLMRFSRGAGVAELAGMREVEKRDIYNLVRPLLGYTKNELLEYLEANSIKYFIDSSNFSKKYERNRFRDISNALLKESPKSGFLRSFKILDQQREQIFNRFKLLFQEGELLVFKVDKDFTVDATVYGLKKLGYLVSFKDRELIRERDSLVIGRYWAVEFTGKLLFISPYIRIKIPKKERERYRVLKIPPKVRGYIFINKIDILGLQNFT